MPIPVDVPAVDRTLLRDDVYHRLMNAIVDGTFAPGEQLKDGDLAAWLGVSRTPVREALLRLAASGLVVAQPGRSTTVSTIDETSLRDARDVVAAMHQLAVRETVGRLEPDDLAQMRAANVRFADAIARSDVAGAIDADEDLHAVPVRVLNNSAVDAVLAQFGPVLRRAERQLFIHSGEASVRRHERLIELCEKGDAEAAASVAFGTWHTLPTDEAATASGR